MPLLVVNQTIKFSVLSFLYLCGPLRKGNGMAGKNGALTQVPLASHVLQTGINYIYLSFFTTAQSLRNGLCVCELL